MSTQGASGYAHPIRTLVVVQPHEDIVERGILTMGQADHLRHRDLLPPTLHLADVAGAIAHFRNHAHRRVAPARRECSYHNGVHRFHRRCRAKVRTTSGATRVRHRHRPPQRALTGPAIPDPQRSVRQPPSVARASEAPVGPNRPATAAPPQS
jgi:hypothetical protein